eukprot:463302-Hanusia_phi.AAC.9
MGAGRINHADGVAWWQVKEALERLMEGRSTLLIAHRTSTLAGSQRIAVIDGGRIVEEGHYDDLISKRDSILSTACGNVPSRQVPESFSSKLERSGPPGVTRRTAGFVRPLSHTESPKRRPRVLRARPGATVSVRSPRLGSAGARIGA